jgi:thioredoxin reductase (NADPH)
VILAAVRRDQVDLVADELTRRYGADYGVLTATSAAEALGTVSALRRDERPLAVVLADHGLADKPGADLLADVAERYPAAKRVLMVPWADRTATDAVLRGTALGYLDLYLTPPWRRGDEEFHRSLTELLQAWDRSNRQQFEWVQVVGERWSPESHALRDLLYRNGVHFGFHDVTSDVGQQLLARAGISGPLPVVLFQSGEVFARPSAAAVAEALGVNVHETAPECDVLILGAGPAGLAAGVYGASEGLRTLLVEPEALGGQAGTSSLIRNYLGFPRGLSGTELAVRAYEQAWLFGARFILGRRADALRAEGSERVVTLDDGAQVRAKTVILALGVTYRRLQIESVERLVGRGVFYGAAMSEAAALRGEPVYVVGGANSAGQAATYLAKYAAKVTMLVRDASLDNDMSSYLIREVRNTPNIDVWYRAEVREALGRERLEGLLVSTSEGERRVEATAVFVLIGAVPRTDWLPPEVVRDERGYILTGADVTPARPAGARPPALFETSLPGVFAVGDVRLGAVRRVAASVGEGSVAIRFVHEYLKSEAEAQLTTSR